MQTHSKLRFARGCAFLQSLQSSALYQLCMQRKKVKQDARTLYVQRFGATASARVGTLQSGALYVLLLQEGETY